MEQLAQAVVTLFDQIRALGPVLFVPIVILLTGLCFGLNWMKASRAAITVGTGFIGVNLTLSIVWDTLSPVTQIIVERFHLSLGVLDASWSAAAAVSFTTQIGVVIIPLVLLMNVVLLFTGVTKTVNIDIWNYWHFAISGALIQAVTGSLVLALVGTACHVVIVLKLADVSAPAVQRELNLPGVSIPHANSVALVPLYLALDKGYDRIPFLRKKGEGRDITDRAFLRWLSDPVVMGFLIGAVLGAIAGVDAVSCAGVAMAMAALMLLLPRAVKVIMEGLIPISQCAKKFMDRRMGGRQFYIGLDSAVTLGHPTTLAASMILIPITLVLAFLLPGNSVIPVGDLVAIGFFIALATPIHGGSLARTLLSGAVTTSLMMLVSSWFAPWFTRLAQQTRGVQVPADSTLISALAIGDPVTWLLQQLLSVQFVGSVLAVVFTAAVVLACKWYERRGAQRAKEGWTDS